MTREIKFRGQTAFGNWAYGNLTICKENRYNGIKKGCFISNEDGTLPWAYEVIPETVGQYIGMKDKKGSEIYEGHTVNVYAVALIGTIEERIAQSKEIVKTVIVVWDEDEVAFTIDGSCLGVYEGWNILEITGDLNDTNATNILN